MTATEQTQLDRIETMLRALLNIREPEQRPLTSLEARIANAEARRRKIQ